MTDPAATRMGEPLDRQVGSRRGVDGGSRPEPALDRSARDRLVRLAYRFLWNLADAEDAVQDTLASAYERRSDLRRDDKWWAWLCRIVVRRCQLDLRERQRRRRHEQPYARETSGRAGDASRVESVDDKGRLRAMLTELPTRQQEVIVLRHLQGMSYREIATVLDIAPATARVHARAGREALRVMLLARHPDFFGRTDGGEREKS